MRFLKRVGLVFLVSFLAAHTYVSARADSPTGSDNPLEADYERRESAQVAAEQSRNSWRNEIEKFEDSCLGCKAQLAELSEVGEEFAFRISVVDAVEMFDSAGFGQIQGRALGNRLSSLQHSVRSLFEPPWKCKLLSEQSTEEDRRRIAQVELDLANEKLLEVALSFDPSHKHEQKHISEWVRDVGDSWLRCRDLLTKIVHDDRQKGCSAERYLEETHAVLIEELTTALTKKRSW